MAKWVCEISVYVTQYSRDGPLLDANCALLGVRCRCGTDFFLLSFLLSICFSHTPAPLCNGFKTHKSEKAGEEGRTAHSHGSRSVTASPSHTEQPSDTTQAHPAQVAPPL